jgi:ABC-type nitrate/sulfonate/bicarbonate transport system substrate-binding protein
MQVIQNCRGFLAGPSAGAAAGFLGAPQLLHRGLCWARAGMLAVHAAYAKKHPAATKRVVRAILKAVRFFALRLHAAGIVKSSPQQTERIGTSSMRSSAS